MELEALLSTLQGKGASLALSIEQLREKLQGIEAFVFDWDGVWNSGYKSPAQPSGFHEGDSMGFNMLRFGYWLRHRQTQTQCAILTGANNEGARAFASREHFHEVYYAYTYKVEALEKFERQYNLLPAAICYVFDDINDLKVAEQVGLRIQVSHPGNLMYNSFTQTHKLYDYRTANPGGQFAVRELCEMLLCTYGNYETVVKNRSEFTPLYQRYYQDRNGIQTAFQSGKVSPA